MKVACWTLGAATILGVLFELGRVTVGPNLHAVVPGQVYRSAQLSAGGLERVIRSKHIRTIINLRGCCDHLAWYVDQARTTQRLDVAQEDICFSAGRLPSSTELRRLVEVLDRTEYPVLLHCRRGADRTGMAAVIVLLLQSDLPFKEALGHLGVRFGHVAVGRTANLDRFFVLYADWLKGQGLGHSRERFRHWVLHEYAGERCRAALEFKTPPPAAVPRGRPAELHVRAHNRGTAAWHFRRAAGAGIHVGLHVWDEQGRPVTLERFGHFDAEVPPGGAIDLTLVVPPLGRPGRYRLMIDLVEERHCWFFQAGSEPLEEELTVRD